MERSARKVTVSELVLEDYAGNQATISVSCSKGTYVRVLAEDIGEVLGCGAHLAGLVRTAVGAFRIEQARRLEDIEVLAAAERTGLLLPVDILIQDLASVQLPDHLENAFLHGRPVAHPEAGPDPGPVGRIRVYGRGGKFLGLAFADGAGGLHPKRLLLAA